MVVDRRLRGLDRKMVQLDGISGLLRRDRLPRDCSITICSIRRRSQHDLRIRDGQVNGVAAKVAQEIRVLLKHDDFDAHARQEEAQHHSGRSVT